MPNPIKNILKKNQKLYSNKFSNDNPEQEKEKPKKEKNLGPNGIESTPKSPTTPNTNNAAFISLKMFNSSLVVILLDYMYFCLYALPLCVGIDFFRFKEAFIYLLMVVVIAYQCDNGALFFGNNFGKHKFGVPITPSKTKEGVYGGLLTG
jgi:hypothetical protein